MNYYLYPLYHLQRDPFSTNVDRASLFMSAGHQLALQSVVAGIEERKGIVVLYGASGLGKTTLMRSYMESIEPQTLKVIYLTDAALPFAKLLDQLYGAFDCKASTEVTSHRMSDLSHVFLETYHQKCNIALVIDNAHDLPQATLVHLGLLADLEVDRIKLLQIVLLGQPPLAEVLNHSALQQLKQHIAVTAELLPLTSDESVDYIRHRLGQVATDDEPIFSPEALQLLVKQARGIPGTLNMLCTDVLNTGLSRAERPIGAATVQVVMADFGLYSQDPKWSWVLGRVSRILPRAQVPIHGEWRALYGVWLSAVQRLRDECQGARLHMLSAHIARLASSGWHGMRRGSRVLRLGAKAVTERSCAVTQSLLPHMMQPIRSGLRELRLLRIDTLNTRLSSHMQYQASRAADAALLQVNQPRHRLGWPWILVGLVGVLLLVGIGWFSWYATQAERFPVGTNSFRHVLSGLQHHDAARQDERAPIPVAIAQETPSTVIVEPSQPELSGSQPADPARQDKKAATPDATAREAQVTVGRLRQHVRHDVGSSVRGGGEQIRLLQERLHAAGFTPGPIDGIFGPRTRHAIRRFQEAHGLRATGRLNVTTRQALGF